MRKLISPILFLLCPLAIGQTYQVRKTTIKCEVKEIKGFNTKETDFSPYVHENTMYFTSSREFDLTHYGENNWKRNGYLNVFKGKITGEINEESKLKNIQLVSEKIKTNNHTGPVALSATGDTLFFTQVSGAGGSKKTKTKPQLFMAVRKGNSWDQITKLPFNEEGYSFGHPSYDSQKKRLYFSSDMKGGKGGKDIYYSDIKNGQWSKPKNMTEVNTSSDELYPFSSGDIFFFCSDRSGGAGGLDIYWCETIAMDVVKSLEGINSEADDFGMYVFPGMTKGYFSSNRKGTTNDDIYFLYMEKGTEVTNEMLGKFTYRNLDGEASGLKVKIVDEDDNMLFETTTDKDGGFTFKNIDYEGAYKIKAISEEDLELTLFDENGNPITTLLTDEAGAFTYKKLDGEDAGTLSLIPEDMIDLDLKLGHLSGQFIYENFPGKYPNGMKVALRDENGNIKISTLTDQMGNFEFKKLSMEENYLLHMDEIDEPLVLLIFDSSGNVVAQMKTNDKGDFVYRKLDPSYSNDLKKIPEADDLFTFETQTIAGQFEYKNLSAAKAKGLKVFAYSEDGFLLQEVTTDDKGFFRFRDLPPSSNLLFKMDESDPNLEMDDYTLYIFDRDGKKVAKLRRGQDGYFIFKPLGFETSDLTTKNDSVDFTLETKMEIVTVYFGSNAENVKSSDLPNLNKLYKVLKAKPSLKIEINAYADARSSDEYNLTLSQKRGDWVVRYLSKKGIDKSRFIVNAYGEAKLVDAEKHELNRRAEIRVY